jgi:hypothetical protein
VSDAGGRLPSPGAVQLLHYFDPELPGVVLLGGGGGVAGVVVSDGVRAGGVVVDGDAEGVRSPGRSPTRSLRSVQPAITPAPSTSAETTTSNLFIRVLLCPGRVSAHGRALQSECPRSAPLIH